MKKLSTLYEKNALLFALVWIGIYVVLFSLADGLSEAVGIEKCITAPVAIGMSLVLLRWVRKNDLSVQCGLKRGNAAASDVLWYVPLVVLVSANLWGGFAMNLTAAESLLYVVTMFGVGFLEELIFRGFLFRALAADGLKRAVFISSITFGIGHIVNLLNGAAFVPTMLQILYASAIGYLFTILFLRTGTLLPCIIAHGLFNALSVFAAERSAGAEIAVVAALIALPLLYAGWIRRGDWQRENGITD